MHVAKARTASSKIILEFAHVNREQREIHCLDVLQFNTVASTINVHLEQFAELESVPQFVSQIAIVSMTNCACKESVNQHVTIIRRALISNSAKTTFVPKKFDAELTTIAY